MTSDRKKPGVTFWATVVLVAVLSLIRRCSESRFEVQVMRSTFST